MTRFPGPRLDWFRAPGTAGVARYALELGVVGAAYLALAKLGWISTAAIEPGAIPIWPPAGLALAAVLVVGSRVWPAIFSAAWVASAQFGDAGPADWMLASTAVAAGSAVEALVGGYLTNLWSSGRRTFDTAAGVVKFALIGFGPGSMLGAAIGIGGVGVTAHVERDNRAETFELAARRRVSWMARQAGIACQGDAGMACETLGQCHRVALRPLQPQCQCPGSAHR